jgi:hypothetical protein
MKALALVIMSITLFGCANGRLTLKPHSPELNHKCQIDPYYRDCLQPPPIYHN